jgi:glycosyltransferase involved in cell wall biosynthesis
MSSPFVSVIIPVFEDAERLRKCLKALSQQIFPETQWEIIVVDNGPSRSVRDCVAEFTNTRYLIERTPTQFAARNTGIRECQGEILAFTDADCIPEPNWLAKGMEKLTSTPNCGLVAGHIEVFPEKENQATAIELFEMITALPQEELVRRWGFGATANIFTFRHVMDSVGLFDCSLASGGDLEWGQRVSQAGYQVVYASQAVIKHPARKSWSALRGRTIRVIGGVHQITEKRYPNQPMRRRFLGLIKNLWKDWPSLADFWAIYNDPRIPSTLGRIQVLLITVGVKMVRYSERIRLWAGGSSRTDYGRNSQPMSTQSS